MEKSILITGSTDGIGLQAARMLVTQGHHVLLHGRNAVKLGDVERSLSALPGTGHVDSYLADLSRMADVEELARQVAARHSRLDVLVNNAGVYNAPKPVTSDGLDIRFAVNAIAPYLLTRRLLPLLGKSSRVVNLSSAAQSPVDINAIAGRTQLTAGTAYAQSKLALTMWSSAMAHDLEKRGPVVLAVNPGSMLGSKMVKEAFGVQGGDIRIGAEVLCRAALGNDFGAASGRYFDNDSGQFTLPHRDALDLGKCNDIVAEIESVLNTVLH